EAAEDRLEDRSDETDDILHQLDPEDEEENPCHTEGDSAEDVGHTPSDGADRLGWRRRRRGRGGCMIGHRVSKPTAGEGPGWLGTAIKGVAVRRPSTRTRTSAPSDGRDRTGAGDGRLKGLPRHRHSDGRWTKRWQSLCIRSRWGRSFPIRGETRWRRISRSRLAWRDRSKI